MCPCQRRVTIAILLPALSKRLSGSHRTQNHEVWGCTLPSWGPPVGGNGGVQVLRRLRKKMSGRPTCLMLPQAPAPVRPWRQCLRLPAGGSLSAEMVALRHAESQGWLASTLWLLEDPTVIPWRLAEYKSLAQPHLKRFSWALASPTPA